MRAALMTGRATAVGAALALLLSRQAESLNFLQSDRVLESRGCTELINQGTHFGIDVHVGTPPQTFRVIADTGSNTLIVPSCTCMDNGKCPKTDRCFKGANKSSTFQLLQDKAGGPCSMVLSFGSGQVQGVIAKEKVRVGAIEQWMEDGLLLMTDRALETKGTFEGILGLGVPIDYGKPQQQQEEEEQDNQTDKAPKVPEQLQKIIDQIVSGQFQNGSQISADAPGGDGMQEALRKVNRAQPHVGGIPIGSDASASKAMRAYGREFRSDEQAPKGFLEQANIARFSMCFNDGADGVLRIDTPEQENSHGGVGKAHWGVDFRGISVGGATTPGEALFCLPENLSADQETPCGAVPDSGTTMLVGPPDHVVALMETICDQWDRCSKNYTALLNAEEKAEQAMRSIYGTNPFNMKTMTKGDVVQILLLDCESWMDHGRGLAELPSLWLHIEGSNGTQQSLELTSNAYVLESPVEKMSTLQLLSGIGNGSSPLNVTGAGNRTGKVCSPAFNTIDFTTQNHGPVWILGTPIFYEYVVGYDASTVPPSMSFSSQKETPCGSCRPEAQPLNMLDTRGFQRERHLRKLRKKPRMSSIDITKGL